MSNVARDHSNWSTVQQSMRRSSALGSFCVVVAVGLGLPVALHSQEWLSPRREASASPAILQLASHVRSRNVEEIDAFWANVKQVGTPIIEPAAKADYQLVTFIYHADDDVVGVRLESGINTGSDAPVSDRPQARARYVGFKEFEWLPALFARTDPQPSRFYLSAGVFETGLSDTNRGHYLLATNRHMRDVLTARQYDFAFVEFTGAHNEVNWEDQMAAGLTWLWARP